MCSGCAVSEAMCDMHNEMTWYQQHEQEVLVFANLGMQLML